MSRLAASPAAETYTANEERRHVAPNGQQFVIRPARSLEELEQCIAMQQQTWGYSDLEVVPRNIYVLAQALGGHVLLATEESGGVAGFAMAIAAHQPAEDGDSSVAGLESKSGWMQPPGAAAAASHRSNKPPIPYLHSHLVAVAPHSRSSGLGLALKLAQRETALAAGIGWLRWTFDPMMARNAAFNLNRVGAVVRRYIPDFYGTLSSALQSGLPTDRFLAEWELTGERAQGAASGTVPPLPVEHEIELPAEIPVWKQMGSRDLLEAAQRHLRAQFVEAFANDLSLHHFAADGRGGGRYQLAASARPSQHRPGTPDENRTHFAASSATGQKRRNA